MSARGAQVEPDDAGEVKASAENEFAERKRTQALLSAQRRSLQLLAAGANLTGILQDLCDTIDASGPGNYLNDFADGPRGRNVATGRGSARSRRMDSNHNSVADRSADGLVRHCRVP